MIRTKNLVLASLLAMLASCKTSGDLKSGDDSRGAVDASGVRTLDAPPSSGVGEIAVSNEPASGESVQRQLITTQAELEELRMQIERERAEWSARQLAAEENNRKLQEALAQRTVAPAPVPVASEDKNTPDLLWNQALEAVQKKNDEEALVALKTLLSTYPKSKRTWGGTIVSGMVEYRMKNYNGAAIHFNQAIDLASKRAVGPSLPWYFQGMAFLKLKKKDDATLFLGELDRRFPKTPANAKAKAVQSGKNRVPNDLFADMPNWLDFVGP